VRRSCSPGRSPACRQGGNGRHGKGNGEHEGHTSSHSILQGTRHTGHYVQRRAASISRVTPWRQCARSRRRCQGPHAPCCRPAACTIPSREVHDLLDGRPVLSQVDGRRVPSAPAPRPRSPRGAAARASTCCRLEVRNTSTLALASSRVNGKYCERTPASTAVPIASRRRRSGRRARPHLLGGLLTLRANACSTLPKFENDSSATRGSMPSHAPQAAVSRASSASASRRGPRHGAVWEVHVRAAAPCSGWRRAARPGRDNDLEHGAHWSRVVRRHPEIIRSASPPLSIMAEVVRPAEPGRRPSIASRRAAPHLEVLLGVGVAPGAARRIDDGDARPRMPSSSAVRLMSARGQQDRPATARREDAGRPEDRSWCP